MNESAEEQQSNSSHTPNKRLDYHVGMFMTADDWRQEQEHFEWKHALAKRWLHGYGTVSGLKVYAAADSSAEIRVEPGIAVAPSGHWIWLQSAQSARLDEWVDSNQMDAQAPRLPGIKQVYVLACYEEVPVDPVPVGIPYGSTDSEEFKPSRILETARITFSWTPPQVANAIADRFCTILASVVITDEAGLDESERLHQHLADLVAEKATAGHPPAASTRPSRGRENILLWRDTADQTIQKALVFWVTELLPATQTRASDCIFLARLEFEVGSDGLPMPETIRVDSSERPLLLSTQVQQMLLTLLVQDRSRGFQDGR